MALTRGSSKWRYEEWGDPCTPLSERILITKKEVPLWVDKRVSEAMRYLGDMCDKHNYTLRPAVTGAYNCRKIKNMQVMSSHAWGTAVDINWDTNAYSLERLITDIPKELVNDILALVTKQGVPVFRWGGDWDGRPETPHSNYDAMHFEVIATPIELAQGLIKPGELMPEVDYTIIQRIVNGAMEARDPDDERIVNELKEYIDKKMAEVVAQIKGR